MAYVVTSPCVGTKDMACVPACPVDCIYKQDPNNPAQLINLAGETVPLPSDLGDKEYPAPKLADGKVKEKDMPPQMVFIHPGVCIDCNACVDPCPVAAIYSADDVPDTDKDYIDLNKKVFE